MIDIQNFNHAIMNALTRLVALSFLVLMPAAPLLAQVDDCERDVERRLEVLGIVLPSPAPPVANYVPAVRSGNLVFLAGAGPMRQDGTYVTGRLGYDTTLEEGYEASRLAGISLLAALKAEIGDLNRVTRIVKVFGMVNSTPDFFDHPRVINGFSDLMVEVFGERGRHARAVAGFAALPLNFVVEIEMVVEIEDD
jgi:enamine deaminase RidA (YjgF/YER057c/UK114 family)